MDKKKKAWYTYFDKNKYRHSISHVFKDFPEGIAHRTSGHSRVKQLFPLHNWIIALLLLPPKTTEVAKPETKEFKPSYFPLRCSTMHSKRTKRPPNVAKPLAVPFIFLQSFLKTMAVEFLIFPIYILLISTEFINMAMTNPIAPPMT